MSVASAALPVAPATTLRVLPARRSEPLFDDEAAEPFAGPVTVLPLDGSVALTLPIEPARGTLRLVHPAPTPDTSARSRPAPPVRDWAHRLVHGLTEVITGARPAAQLSRHLSPDILAKVERHAMRQIATNGGVRLPAVKTVRSVHICRPAEDIAEVAAVVRRGERVAAIALRLEARHDRWLCTALELG